MKIKYRGIYQEYAFGTDLILLNQDRKKERSHSGLVRTLGKRVNLQGFRGFESPPLRQHKKPIYAFLLQLPGQCIWPCLVQTAVFIANAIIERLLVVAPKEAPPVPKCVLYTAIMAAISANVSRAKITLPTIAHGLEEQQDFIGVRVRSFCIVLDPRACAQHTVST